MFALVFLAFWFLSWITGDDQLAFWLLIGGFVAYFLWLVPLDVKDHLGKQGPREAALSEASYGAAMMALPVLYREIGMALSGWFMVAMIALMIFGALKFFRGAKYSVGWRDPVLMARFAAKIGLG